MTASSGKRPKPPKTFPPRLHVIFARESKTAVVIRRGPNRHVATIGWDRRTDSFELGQWLYGRIYERRCDLSPDGKHFIYFAMNGRWESQSLGSWTAISRAPYLKAKVFYAKGDCWHGGGLFNTSDEYWLNEGYGRRHRRQRDESKLSMSDELPWHESYGGECLGVYFIRLQRDGWKMKQEVSTGRHEGFVVFDKPINVHWTLRKHAHYAGGAKRSPGRGVYFDTHKIIDTQTGETTDHPDWEWAEVDRGRLVWACQGKLSAARLGSDGMSKTKELFDFNPMKFEKIRAPY